MIHYNVPTMQYDYALGERAATDYLWLDTRTTGPGKGRAVLHLNALSPGKLTESGRIGPSLTHVRISIDAPGCEIMGLSPDIPFIDTASIVGQTACWEQRAARAGSQMDYSIEYAVRDGGARRFEFRVQASELKQPIRLFLDVDLEPAEPSTRL
jgi:hypothetical protein